MRKLATMVIVIALGVGLAACSSDSKKSGLSGKTSNHGEKVVANGAKVEVEADNDGSDYYFKPTYIKAKGGSTITLELKNEGNTAHTFTIDEQNIDTTLDPDKTAEVKVTIPQSGLVRFYCKFHGDNGMQGALVAT